MEEKKFQESITNIMLQLARIDTEMQALIKASDKDGKLKGRKRDIIDVLTTMSANAEFIGDLLDDPSQIQDVICEK